jgi:geranylgeranyl pyrophosphate synthase
MLGKSMLVVVTRASLKKQNSQVLLTQCQITFLTSGKKWRPLYVVIALPNSNCESDVTQHFRIVRLI